MKKLTPNDLEHLITDIGEIPTLPSIATTIMEKTLDENVNAKQIADMVEKDQGLSLKVLKVANSPFYRRIKEISTIRGAVVLLGLNVLKSIVLSISVINLFEGKKKNAMDLFDFWQHSIACAVCAKEIANMVYPASSEDAFVAGLLHDMGKIVADQQICKEGEYEKVLEAVSSGRDVIAVEEELIGISHATMGKILMEHWNLPSRLTMVVAHHHELPKGGVMASEENRLCAIVHVADMVINHLGLGICPHTTGFIEPTILNQLGLSSHDIQAVSLRIKDSIADISEQLGIPKAEPKTYFEVLQTANAQLGKLSLDLEQKKHALEQRTMELSKINQMSAELQSSMKLSEITKVLTNHSLTIMGAKKCRCIMRLSQLRVMVTDSFWVGDNVQTRNGVAGATKELLDHTNGIYEPGCDYFHAPIRVDDKIIGALELFPDEENKESQQQMLLLRTISEIGSQAIQRAMLITKNMKSQRLAAVSKTAIAANHEINSPLTTVLLKTDLLLRDPEMPTKVVNGLEDIKREALKIQSLVKKMLEISDVVETDYTANEKMLDIHKAAAAKAPATPAQPKAEEEQGDMAPGFEDYLKE